MMALSTADVLLLHKMHTRAPEPPETTCVVGPIDQTGMQPQGIWVKPATIYVGRVYKVHIYLQKRTVLSCCRLLKSITETNMSYSVSH